MRSGLLAVGVILLVLGAIFYFVPTPASAETNTQSVRTETYAGLDDKETDRTNTGDTWDTWGNGTNQTNRTMSTTSTTERVTVADTTSNDQVGDERIGNPDSVIYIYIDDNGDMYSESGVLLGEGASGTTTVSDTTGMTTGSTARTTSGTTTRTTGTTDTTTDTSERTTVSDSYGTSGTVSDSTGRADAGTTGQDRVNTADTTTTETVQTGSAGSTAGTTGGAEDDVIFDDQATAENDDALSQDEDAIAETGGFASDNDSNNTAGSTLLGDDERGAAGGATGSGWIRTLAVLAMVLGAILAILGLILPSRDRYDDRVDTRARTTAPAGRRVRYEREEEREVRK